MSDDSARNRVYLTFSRKAGKAYIGQGPDSRIDEDHSDEYKALVKEPDAVQWASSPFSSKHDADIAEAVALAIAVLFEGERDMQLINIQKASRKFAPRYPIPYVEGSVAEQDLPRAIIVTIAPDKLENDSRAAPNSAWTPQEFAERVRKYWSFAAHRVEQWIQGEGAPDYLVAVAKGTGRILAVFAIDNNGWEADPENQERFQAVPLQDAANANANDMQGKVYVGNRGGGAVRYGKEVG
jgi:hypothetical protein